MLHLLLPTKYPSHLQVGYEQDPNGDGLIRTTPNPNVIVPTRYPFEYTLATETLEGTLRENLEGAGSSITYSAAPLSIEKLDTAAGEEPLVKVDFILFCKGGYPSNIAPRSFCNMVLLTPAGHISIPLPTSMAPTGHRRATLKSCMQNM
jgi:hypothetical protein